MKLTKQWFCALLCLTLTAGTFAGCGAERPPDGGKPRIVTTIVPLYDWTRELLGSRTDAVDLVLLLDSGVDLHSFQPTVDDMVRISECGLFVYVGGESDDWVSDALAGAADRDRIVVNLMEVLGDAVKEEETVEGMEGGGDADGGEAEYDEHVWLSLRNAKVFCAAMADALSRLDPDGAAEYAENLAAYTARLDDLDARYQAAVDAASTRTLLFGDRFPFRYLADDYSLAYYAAFPGCSAETEASFATVVFLAGKVDELGLHTVLTIDGGGGKIARTIVENTAAKDARVLKLDSMQSVTSQDAAGGASYLSIMEQNLEVLREALK